MRAARIVGVVLVSLLFCSPIGVGFGAPRSADPDGPVWFYVDSSISLEPRPSSVALAMTSPLIGDLRWSTWGGEVARGYGTAAFEVSRTRYQESPAILELSNIKVIDGKRQYTCYHLIAEDPGPYGNDRRCEKISESRPGLTWIPGRLLVPRYPGSISFGTSSQLVGEPTLGLGLDGEVRRTRSEPYPVLIEGVSCERVGKRVEVTVDADLSPKVTAAMELTSRRLGYTASSEVGYGGGFSYTMRMTPEQFRAIRSGRQPLPFPLQPQTMPEGTEVELSARHFATLAAKGSLTVEAKVKRLVDEALRLSGTFDHEAGQEARVTVERVDQDHVRLKIGEARYLRQFFMPAIHRIPLPPRYQDLDVSEGALRQVDFDVSTEPGWQAYQRALLTADLPGPDEDRSYLSNGGDTRTSDYSYNGGIGADVGPLQILFPPSQTTNLSTTKTDYDDGRREDATSYQVNDIVYVTKRVQDAADDESAGEAEHVVLLPDVPERAIQFYRTGVSRGASESTRHIHLTFTEEELKTLQVRAWVTTAVRCRETVACDGYDDPPETGEEVKDYIREHTTDEADQDLDLFNNPVLRDVAYAETPSEVIVAFQDNSGGAVEDFLRELETFAVDTGLAIEGERARANRFQDYLPGALPTC